jgi:hypothetical protein
MFFICSDIRREKNTVYVSGGNRNHFAVDIFNWLYTTEQEYTDWYINVYIYWMNGKRNTISCCHCSDEHNDLGGMSIWYILKWNMHIYYNKNNIA